MDGGAQLKAMTMEDIFKDFKSRRAGLIKALTTDVEEFKSRCDPDQENLYLYGYSGKRWEVRTPDEKGHFFGIPVCSDGMTKDKEWLGYMARCCDAWLMMVYFRYAFDKADRKRLFLMMNDLPPMFHVVAGTAQQQDEEEEEDMCSICAENDVVLRRLEEEYCIHERAELLKCSSCSSSSSN